MHGASRRPLEGYAPIRELNVNGGRRGPESLSPAFRFTPQLERNKRLDVDLSKRA
jgi:hypothetical protein